MTPNNWPINDDTAELLERRLQANPPKMALDVGSGRSTVIMARYAERVIALEHDEKFFKQTVEMLMANDLLNCDVWLQPITSHHAGPWYTNRVEIPGVPNDPFHVRGALFDFVMIDGPPQKIGRQAGLPLIWPHLAQDFEIWLDDWDRPHEKQCVKEWTAKYPIQIEELSPTLLKITRA